jgi:4-amino-4-deoxy-L-arabinose transferase-like glycosyltransferase
VKAIGTKPPGAVEADGVPRGPSPSPAGHRDGAMVVAVFVLLAMLYLVLAPDTWLMRSDSAVYMGLARSLAHGEGYTFNHSPHGKYPPVFPLMLTTVYATLGENIWAMQALVALTGVGALIATFLLIRARSGTRPALAIVVLTGLCTWFCMYSSLYILSDMPYTLFSLIALGLMERAARSQEPSALKWLPATAMAVVATYTRMAGVALIPALVGTALLARGQQATPRQRWTAAGVAGFIAILAPAIWLVCAWRYSSLDTYTGMVSAAKSKYLSDLGYRLQLRFSEWAATPLSRGCEKLPWAKGLSMLCLLLLPGLVRGFRRFRSGAEFYLCAYFLVMLFVGGYGGRERYVVPVAPLLFYYGYLSLSTLSGWLSEKLAGCRRTAPGRGLHWAIRHLAVIVGMVVLFSAIQKLAKCDRQTKPFSGRYREAAKRRVDAWRRASEWSERYLPEDAKIYGRRNFVHFFTGHLSLPLVRDDDARVQLSQVLASGAGFLIVEDWEVSAEFLKPVVASHPECFTPICGTVGTALYRIERRQIKETLRGLKARSATGAPGGDEGKDDDEEEPSEKIE